MEIKKLVTLLVLVHLTSLYVFYNVLQTLTHPKTNKGNQDAYRIVDPFTFQPKASQSAGFLNPTVQIFNYEPTMTLKEEMQLNTIKNAQIDELALLNKNQPSTDPNHTLVLVGDDEKFSKENNPFYILGAYPNITFKYIKANYSRPNYGLFNDEDYCQIVDYYNLAHPENMFEEMNLFADYGFKGEEMVRHHFVRKYTNDMMKEVSNIMLLSVFNSRKYHLDHRINNFFTKRADFHAYHKLGVNFGCATQMVNHIPGHDIIWRKDLVVDSYNRYAKSFENRPQCLDKETYFPSAYRLYNKQECTAFFDLINSEDYKASLKVEPMQYLIKIGFGAHRAQGVFLLDDNQTLTVNTDYDYGKKCGLVTKSLIAQKYVADPLLLDLNNKFDFRIYMLVASTNPLIVYYHDGFLRVSVTPYDKHSTERGVHLTNTFVNKVKFAEAAKENKTIHGMNEQQLRDYHIWEFDRLQSYLLESGKVSDPNWIDNYLRPSFKKAFIHTVRMGAYSFWNQSNVYEFFGLDFMLDDQLNLWFIELNASPQFVETNERSLGFLTTMLKDMFEITYSLYRSRMKRILNVIQRMEIDAKENGNPNYAMWREEYKAAAKNRFEPEYEISSDNTFSLIIDQNRPGVEAYMGFLKEECIPY